MRGVPDDVHAALQQRAEDNGQSLQQYLMGEASRPTIGELLDRIDQRRGGRVGLGRAATGYLLRARRTVIVIDASVLANALGDDEAEGRRARSKLRQAGDVPPDLIDVETVSVLRRRWLAKTLGAHRFRTAVDDLGAPAVQRYPTLPFTRRAYELRAANVTAYDAAYVPLAEALGCELLTTDVRLANAPGPRCNIRVRR